MQNAPLEGCLGTYVGQIGSRQVVDGIATGIVETAVQAIAAAATLTVFDAAGAVVVATIRS